MVESLIDLFTRSDGHNSMELGHVSIQPESLVRPVVSHPLFLMFAPHPIVPLEWPRVLSDDNVQCIAGTSQNHDGGDSVTVAEGAIRRVDSLR